jgi:hypothetical protein
MTHSLLASWQTIVLGDLPCRYGRAPELGRDEGRLSAMLIADPDGDLRLQLTACLPQQLSHAGFASRLPRAKAVDVTLVNGTYRYPSPIHLHPFSSVTYGWGGARFHDTWDLPWPADPLADTSLEIRIDDTTWTIELPYGLCRDETLPLAQSFADHDQRQAGTTAPTTRQWEEVEFEGQWRGNTFLRLKTRSREPGILEIGLSRDPHAQRGRSSVDLTVAPVTDRRGRGRPAHKLADGSLGHLSHRFRAEAVSPGRYYAEIVVRCTSSGPCSDLGYHVVLPSSLLDRYRELCILDGSLSASPRLASARGRYITTATTRSRGRAA